jgi:hypothetical protein
MSESALIKSTWNDVHKYLHAVFVMYNRFREHDSNMGEWCSPKQQECWIHVSVNKTNGSKSIVRFPTVMINSISVLEEADFESLGRTRIDNSVNDGMVAKGTKRKSKGKQNKKKKRSS